ncbi:MAG: Na/Pi cotransporter family protein [Clostridium argentinense]|uniref:Na/Pi cotransporter family protein n=1 Tax=Clostridium faecium TaxID=2762223 RepID=A0ABR8YMX6_9CLOT|nr:MULTISPECIES: Na/Pi cotransporter family protein [Clostridium]MBD8045599.1 Na/Pi cotransporter family protein [Clostridium faecium]MBS5823488.1 Na/Pi cotransporter family protein [Clostridium argentinense]MDU1349906.1 Na/Pi cotransporter family protein [Clostridium argentinense]
MEVFITVINLFGGLGLFLYGMKMMGDGLENAAGDKLKGIFDRITSNPVKGVLTGAIVTAIIQSSSATTVMVVGFVNAGLMNLYQATAVIMGANIGTTITAQLISFQFDALAPIFLAIGAMIVLFTNNKNTKQIGNIILGFGILFLGLELMKNSMSPLAESPFFSELIMKLQGKTILGVLLGVVMTAVIQSSSASTGILVALASTGALPLNVAVPILFGNNIGTCVTALISSIGTSKTAKKAALIHLLFNVIGTIIFIPLIGYLTGIVQGITPGMGAEAVKRQIANAHSIFNIINTLILMPCIKLLVYIVNKIIPGEDEHEAMGVQYIDERLLETPIIALGQTTNELVRMANKAKENLELAMDAFNNKNEESLNKVYANEKLINILEDDITKFLVKLSNTEIGEEQKNIVAAMFHVVNDIERIGDHAENIADLASEKMSKHIVFSEEATKELLSMFNYTVNALEMSIDCFKNYNKEKARTVRGVEERIDNLEKELRASHIRRLNTGVCNATVGAIFLDVISNFERIGDHAVNIAEIISETPYKLA